MARMPGVRYRQAANDFGPRDLDDVLGLNWHMAESAPGGCVSCYLAGDPLRGVSANFTVEDTGEIVQCLDTLRIPGAINVNDIRRTDDPDGFYGYSTNRAVLGDKWYSPNRHQIIVEVGGKASVGPNSKQADAMFELRDWCFATHPALRGQTAHRDFADYKACPGRMNVFHPPWSLLHHGLWKPNEEPDMEAAVIPFTDWKPRYATVKKGAQAYAGTDEANRLHPLVLLSAETELPVAFDRGDYIATRVSTGATPYQGPELVLFRKADVIRERPYAPEADCDAAVLAEYQRVTKAAVTAIAAIPKP